MQNSRLFKYLSSLNNKEWKNLKLRIEKNNPVDSDTQVLFLHIWQHRNNLNHPKTELSYIQENVLLNKSKKRIQNNYSLITEEVKDLLVADQLNKEPYTKKLLLQQALINKGLPTLSEQIYHQTINDLDNEEISTWKALHQMLAKHHHYFSSTNRSKKGGDAMLQDLITAAKLFHHQIRSLYKFELVNNQNLNIAHFLHANDPFIIDSYQDDLLTDIYFNLESVLTKESLQSVNNLKHILFKPNIKVSNEIILTISIILRRHYSKRVNKGEMKFTEDLFELQKFMIENNYLIYNNKISPLSFMPIVSLASFSKKISWVKNFINENIQYVQQKDRAVIENIARSFVLFAEEKFEECIEKTSQIYISNFTLKSIVNRLQLIAYIELYKDNKMFLKNRLDNYRLFNLRNKKSLSTKTYTGNVNFHKILSMIVNDTDQQSIKEKMISTEILYYRQYLFNKLERIKNGPR